jgi:hypothetical protein
VRQQRPDLAQPLLDDLDGPVHDRQDAAPLGWTAPGRLAVAHSKDADVVELWRLGIGPEVVDVQHGDLPAAQAPRVGDLEQGCVAERRQPALAAGVPRSGDLVVGLVEQPLQLRFGERPADRVAFIVAAVAGGVPGETDLDGVAAEPPLALVDPAVAAIRQISEKRPDCAFVAADGRADPLVLVAQVACPFLKVLR